tara:strand:+ start:21 stop:206 length:186 start_codon:yes stop_codon:yes gene_type:complete
MIDLTDKEDLGEGDDITGDGNTEEGDLGEGDLGEGDLTLIKTEGDNIDILFVMFFSTSSDI